MKICHFTNTFLPHVGGVARAVQTMLEDQRRARHRVFVVAPEFDEGAAPGTIERSVVRIPAFTHFNDSDFSVRIPFAATLSKRLADFRADIIHAHHPFLLGDTALREAAGRQVPVVFTHHTLYERYTHYLPVESNAAGDFAAEIATRFANRCAAVVAPSESVRDLIVSRGVIVPVHVVPTGVDTARLGAGQGPRARSRWGIPAKAPVIGHLGRLAPEKNLPYLAEAIGLALKQHAEARALIIGEGPSREEMEKTFASLGISERVVFTGKLTGPRLLDACAAMNVFAFASTSETQGLVLAEAMAAGAAVVALDASGVREVVRDHENGLLLPAASPAEVFAHALHGALRNRAALARWAAAARETAAGLDRAKTSARLAQLYEQLVAARRVADGESSALAKAVKPVVERIAIEGKILADKTGAFLDAMNGDAPATGEPAAAASSAG